jgi:hypothetical protein
MSASCCRCCCRPGVAATTGVPVPALLELLSRSLGLVSVPTELLASSLERLAADLACRPCDIVELITRQPTLLCAQVRVTRQPATKRKASRRYKTIKA